MNEQHFTSPKTANLYHALCQRFGTPSDGRDMRDFVERAVEQDQDVNAQDLIDAWHEAEREAELESEIESKGRIGK